MTAPAGVGPVLLEPVLIGYPWGDPDTIPRLLGRRPDGRPVAELWIGAEGVPVLVKVLAVAAPLSLQLHPDDESAARGHAAGLAGFTAPYGKPELLLAISPFLSLSGLRPAADSLAVLAGLGLDHRAAPALRPALGPVLDALHAGDPAAALAAALTAGEQLADAVSAALGHDRSPGLELARRVAVVHAGDPALAATLLLRPHRLEPGEALWCPPGCPHVHVSGCGVEVQTDADTTLRAGLTAKPRDAATFLANLRTLPPERPEPVRVGHRAGRHGTGRPAAARGGARRGRGAGPAARTLGAAVPARSRQRRGRGRRGQARGGQRGVRRSRCRARTRGRARAGLPRVYPGTRSHALNPCPAHTKDAHDCRPQGRRPDPR